MDLALALNKLGIPHEHRGPCAQSDAQYADFAAKWRGPGRPPTEADLEAAWQEVLLERPELALSHDEQRARRVNRLEERLAAIEARLAALEA